MKSPLYSTLRLQQVRIFKNYLMSSKQKRAFLFLLHFESASNKSSLKNKQTKTPTHRIDHSRRRGHQTWFLNKFYCSSGQRRNKALGGVASCQLPQIDISHPGSERKGTSEPVTSHLVVTYSISPDNSASMTAERQRCQLLKQCKKLSRPSTKSHRAARHTSRDTFSGCSTLTRCRQLSTWRTQDWVHHSRDGQLDFYLALVFISMGN